MRVGNCIILSPVRKAGAREIFYFAGRLYGGLAPAAGKTTGATGRKWVTGKEQKEEEAITSVKGA